jgi:hypothetical protein
MANVPYDYINQEIRSSALIQPRDNDSFYNPTLLNHQGFASDGRHYTAGTLDSHLFPITHVSKVGDLHTLLSSNTLQAGNRISLSGFTGDFTYLNGVVSTVLASGLSGSQFKITVSTLVPDSGASQTATADWGASWFLEATGPYRGGTATFPTAGLILLSKVALTILDEATSNLTLWMLFLLSNTFMLTNDFNDSVSGWTPNALTYADGVLSVIYEPDEGATDITSPMVVSMDFVQDRAYLDVAVPQPSITTFFARVLNRSPSGWTTVMVW